jgi:hypothetical protein
VVGSPIKAALETDLTVNYSTMIIKLKDGWSAGLEVTSSGVIAVVDLVFCPLVTHGLRLHVDPPLPAWLVRSKRSTRRPE